MNTIEIQSMMIPIENDVRNARLARQHMLQNPTGRRLTLRLAMVIGMWLSRTGARFRGLSQPITVR